MTEDTIGDPSTSSGHPSGPRHGTPWGHDQTSWLPPHSPAGGGPADQACSFAASDQNLPPPQTASQEEDRKMTGSFTRPTGGISSRRIVKRFGMTNLLLEHDLDRIEQRFGIDLGRAHRRSIEVDEDYYPQIEREFRAEAA